MVRNGHQNSYKTPAGQGREAISPEPNKIGASTRYDFTGKNLTPYGGLLPVITMLEGLGFEALVEETITSTRIPRSMNKYRFVLAIVLGLYIGFSRLNQLRFIACDPMLTGILKVGRLPVQSTFWRFINGLHLNVAGQLLTIMRTLRERVWAATNVTPDFVTLDTDTTVHTLYGHQMGGRKGYNPKNKGKLSYQPMLTFIAETREYAGGELRKGDRPSGKQIGDHLRSVCASLPPGVKQIYGRADAGFYCSDAVESYEEFQVLFVICAHKTSRLLERLSQASWKHSPKTDAAWQCEFQYQPDGWSRSYRFVALRYEKTPEQLEEEENSEQYQLFETSAYRYRVFVTNLTVPVDLVVWFYNQRGSAENLIKEANNDAGLAAHPSKSFYVNCNHFQLAMLAYNLNCWLMLFNREPETDVSEMQHITLATSRLRFLFVAARIWRHSGRTRVKYSDNYPEKDLFDRLMMRLRQLGGPKIRRLAPVMLPSLC